MTAISVRQVSHEFPGRRVLSGVTFDVEKGSIFGLLGPNGGGKTTLFRILSTHLKPTSGSASIFDHDVVSDRMDVRKTIGVLFQNPGLDPKLTLRENLTHQGRLYGLKGSELIKRINLSLDAVGLNDRTNEWVERLSGGMRRRGEIAKTLLHKPSVLIMDEPSTGLDPGARLDFWSHLRDLRAKGITILLTTHLTDEADRCDQIGILHEGRLRAAGTPDDLKSRIGGEVISIQSSAPALLRDKIREKWGDEGIVLNGRVRFEKKAGHQMIPMIMDAFPDIVESVTVGKPTIEDVFIHVTGHRLTPSPEREAVTA